LLDRVARLDLVVDVGMHRGEWADAVRNAHPGVVIHGFEPTPELMEDLTRKYASSPEVVLNGYALGANSGSAGLHLNADNPSLNSMVGPSSPFGEVVDVDVLAGDDYLEAATITKVDFLKVDVEGFDLDVLRGFHRSLSANLIDVVQFEYNEWTLLARHLLADFYELLDPVGYDIGKVHPNGVEFQPYPTSAENWRGPACVAVVRSRPDLRERLATTPRRSSLRRYGTL
jgi:FkbM family methyltransferase